MTTVTTVCVLACWIGVASAGVAGTRPLLPASLPQGELLAEAERVESICVLLRMGVLEAHDARALALYLRNWGGPSREVEVENLFVEADSLFGTVTAVEYGMEALLIQTDVASREPDMPKPSAAQWDLYRRARGEAAEEILGFYKRCHELKTRLAEEL